MTNQEIFDRVARHLLTQGKASYDATRGMCMYRGPDGLKCAAGILILDNAYDPSLEGKMAEELPASTQAAMGLEDEHAVEIVRHLQSIHDNWNACLWARCLRGTANRFNLSFAVVNDLDVEFFEEVNILVEGD